MFLSQTNLHSFLNVVSCFKSLFCHIAKTISSWYITVDNNPKSVFVFNTRINIYTFTNAPLNICINIDTFTHSTYIQPYPVDLYIKKNYMYLHVCWKLVLVLILYKSEYVRGAEKVCTSKMAYKPKSVTVVQPGLGLNYCKLFEVGGRIFNMFDQSQSVLRYYYWI